MLCEDDEQYEVWVVEQVYRSPHGRTVLDAHAQGMPVRKRFVFQGPVDDPLPYKPGQIFHVQDLPPLIGVEDEDDKERRA